MQLTTTKNLRHFGAGYSGGLA